MNFVSVKVVKEKLGKEFLRPESSHFNKHPASWNERINPYQAIPVIRYTGAELRSPNGTSYWVYVQS